MSYGGSTKYCPRCNTLLPAQAPVCGTCGMQFSAPPDPGYGATQYGGQDAPGSWPQSQPGYGDYAPPPPPPPVYTPQPAYPGYPAAVAAPPRKSNTGLIVAIVIALVVVGGGAAGWFLYLNPSLCKGGPFFDRHGQPSSIPMPSGCMFNTMRTVEIGSGISANAWYWTTNSPNDQTAVHSFFTQNLPSNGWTQKEDKGIGNGVLELGYCGNSLALVIDIGTEVHSNSGVNITAPSGGSVFAVATISDSRIVAQACNT